MSCRTDFCCFRTVSVRRVAGSPDAGADRPGEIQRGHETVRADLETLLESLALHRARNWWSSTAIWEAAWASRHRVIEEVQADLQESPGEKGGAFFCSLAGFRDCYRLVYRMSELNGQMPWLMLCTIIDGKGYPAKGGPRLDRMSEKLLE